MSKKGKILIVDDEPNILLSLDFLIRKAGHEVYIARNGTEALALIEDKIPEVIILDIMMPDVDGYQICMKVKQNKKTAHIKVIFLSAKTKESEIQYGLDLGSDAYMTKPFSTRALMQKVDELLKP